VLCGPASSRRDLAQCPAQYRPAQARSGRHRARSPTLPQAPTARRIRALAARSPELSRLHPECRSTNPRKSVTTAAQYNSRIAPRRTPVPQHTNMSAARLVPRAPVGMIGHCGRHSIFQRRSLLHIRSQSQQTGRNRRPFPSKLGLEVCHLALLRIAPRTCRPSPKQRSITRPPTLPHMRRVRLSSKAASNPSQAVTSARPPIRSHLYRLTVSPAPVCAPSTPPALTTCLRQNASPRPKSCAAICCSPLPGPFRSTALPLRPAGLKTLAVHFAIRSSACPNLASPRCVQHLPNP